MSTLVKALDSIYAKGVSSLSNPYLRWIGEQFIKPRGLDYEYFDFDPISSYDEDGVYPVLTGPKIIPVQLPEDSDESLLAHQKAILDSISDRNMVLDISLDNNLNPKIETIRHLDERNSRDRPLIDLVQKVKSSDRYFIYLQASVGIAKIASDGFLRFLVNNKNSKTIQRAVIEEQFDFVADELSGTSNQKEIEFPSISEG